MLLQHDGPGYVYQLQKGATSLIETWDANPATSQNHCMLGHIEEWFYRGVGGISSDTSGPGFKKIIIKPTVVGDLAWVKCSYDSLYGRIVSNWKRESQSLTMDVTIPVNTTATVYVPAKDPAGVTESGKSVEKVPGVKFLRIQSNTAVYAVGSGTYQFQSTMSETVKQNAKGEFK